MALYSTVDGVSDWIPRLPRHVPTGREHRLDCPQIYAFGLPECRLQRPEVLDCLIAAISMINLHFDVLRNGTVALHRLAEKVSVPTTFLQSIMIFSSSFIW